MLQEAQYNLTHYKVDGNQQLLKQLQDQHMICRKEVLIHGDYSIDNVLVHDGQIAAVIDWSGGACGDARYDMALAVRFEDGIFTGSKERKVLFKVDGKQISQREFCYFAEGLYEFF